MLNELQESLNHLGKIYDGKIETKGKIEFADFFGGGGGGSSSNGGENSGNEPFMPTPLPEKNSRKLIYLHFCLFPSN